MQQKIISISNGVARMPEWRMAQSVDFELLDSEHIAIVGPNGGGKSMLVDIIIGRHPLLMYDPEYDFRPSTKELVADNIKYVTFRDSYGDYDNTYYLQQRWNQQEIDESTPRSANCSNGHTTQPGMIHYSVEHVSNIYISFSNLNI